MSPASDGRCSVAKTSMGQISGNISISLCRELDENGDGIGDIYCDTVPVPFQAEDCVSTINQFVPVALLLFVILLQSAVRPPVFRVSITWLVLRFCLRWSRDLDYWWLHRSLFALALVYIVHCSCNRVYHWWALPDSGTLVLLLIVLYYRQSPSLLQSDFQEPTIRDTMFHIAWNLAGALLPAFIAWLNPS